MTKEFKVIKVSDEMSVVVDEEVSTKELLENPEWWVYRRDGTVQKHGQDREGFFCDKIIATIGTQRLEGIPVIEIPEEDEGKRLVEIHFPITTIADDDNREFKINWNDRQLQNRHLWLQGYKAARSKGVYTEEDLEKFFNAGMSYQMFLYGKSLGIEWTGKEENKPKPFYDYLQSLQKKEIKSVVLEIYQDWNSNGAEFSGDAKDVLKISNPETNTIIPLEILYE